MENEKWEKETEFWVRFNPNRALVSFIKFSCIFKQKIPLFELYNDLLNIILKSIGYKIINFHISSYTWTCWEFNRNFKPVRNKKIEKRKRQKKNKYTHKTVFTWFGNLPTSTELQGFHYYKRKLQCVVTVFFFLKKNKMTKP